MNEKALVRQMKEAYRGGGIKVWRMEWGCMDSLMVSAGFWAALIPMEQVPGKILGLLGEWMRRLPLMNEAFLLLHKQEPEALQTQFEEMRRLLERMESGVFCVDLKPAPFFVGDKRAFQRRDDHRMIFFAGAPLELADGFLHTGAASENGDCAQWRQADTDIVVWICPRTDVAPDRAELLAGYDCWKEGKSGD